MNTTTTNKTKNMIERKDIANIINRTVTDEISEKARREVNQHPAMRALALFVAEVQKVERDTKQEIKIPCNAPDDGKEYECYLSDMLDDASIELKKALMPQAVKDEAKRICKTSYGMDWQKFGVLFNPPSRTAFDFLFKNPVSSGTVGITTDKITTVD